MMTEQNSAWNHQARSLQPRSLQPGPLRSRRPPERRDSIQSDGWWPRFPVLPAAAVIWLPLATATIPRPRPWAAQHSCRSVTQDRGRRCLFDNHRPL